MNDELEWRRRKEGEANWRADNHDGTATYIAYIHDDDFGVTRIHGVISDNNNPWPSQQLYVGMGSIAEAKDACQEHNYHAARAARWAAYMRDNEPPVQP